MANKQNLDKHESLTEHPPMSTFGLKVAIPGGWIFFNIKLFCLTFLALLTIRRLTGHKLSLLKLSENNRGKGYWDKNRPKYIEDMVHSNKENCIDRMNSLKLLHQCWSDSCCKSHASNKKCWRNCNHQADYIQMWW